MSRYRFPFHMPDNLEGRTDSCGSMPRRAVWYRANQRYNTLSVDHVQGLGQRSTVSREGIVPNRGIAEFIHHLEQPTAFAVFVDFDLDCCFATHHALTQLRVNRIALSFYRSVRNCCPIIGVALVSGGLDAFNRTVAALVFLA